MSGTFSLPSLMRLHAWFDPVLPGDQPVCHDGQRLICRGEFTARVAGQVAFYRQRHELRWLLLGDDALDFVIRLLALWYAGKQVVIPPNRQAGTLAALADTYDVTVDDPDVLHSDAAGNGYELLAPINPQAAILDLYTSGSSGEHKRVRKTLAQFEAEVAVLETLWGETVGAAAILATAPHQHIYGLLFRLLWPLASGRVFDTTMCANPHLLAARLAVFDRAVLISSPAQLTRLPDLLPLASLEPKPVAVFSSGGPLPAVATRRLAEGFGQAPIEVFGSTETGGVAWRQQDQSDDDLWTPFPGHVLDRSEKGALILRSRFLPDDSPWEMDDGIALALSGRFRLLGRLDRVVKIEEKRLSLPEMEACLAAHAWVETAAVVALPGRRQSVGAVLVLNTAGVERRATETKRSMVQALQQHLARHFDAVLLPRHWRFRESLPTNDSGKLTAAALATIFTQEDPKEENPCLLPDVIAVDAQRSETRQHVVLELHVLPEIAHFAGHFPGAAILPGVVQVDWAIHFARQYLPVEGVFSALEKLKFLAVIRPDARVQLSLVWDGERKLLTFSYATSTQKCAVGNVLFGGAA